MTFDIWCDGNLDFLSLEGNFFFSSMSKSWISPDTNDFYFGCTKNNEKKRIAITLWKFNQNINSRILLSWEKKITKEMFWINLMFWLQANWNSSKLHSLFFLSRFLSVFFSLLLISSALSFFLSFSPSILLSFPLHLFLFFCLCFHVLAIKRWIIFPKNWKLYPKKQKRVNYC